MFVSHENLTKFVIEPAKPLSCVTLFLDTISRPPRFSSVAPLPGLAFVKVFWETMFVFRSSPDRLTEYPGKNYVLFRPAVSRTGLVFANYVLQEKSGSLPLKASTCRRPHQSSETRILDDITCGAKLPPRLEKPCLSGQGLDI